MKKYVAAFFFNATISQVALIQKAKPSWQKGLLNGIGGLIEEGETPLQAIRREFREEAGLDIAPGRWKHFARLEGPDFEVEFFSVIGLVWELPSTQTKEVVKMFRILNIEIYQEKMIENLMWLLHLSLDNLKDGRPEFAIVKYPTNDE